MLEQVFRERGFLALEKGLEALALRQRVIAHNLANVNTPGFKKSEVDFAGALRRYLRDPQGGFRPRVYTLAGTSQRLDGNNVDPEEEMTRLTENALLYEAAARQLSSAIARLRLAISEGRR